MKKRLMSLFVLMVLFVSVGCRTFATAGPRRLLGNSSVSGTITATSYQVTATTAENITQISVSCTLLEKAPLGVWRTVSTGSGSSRSARCVASQQYQLKGGRSYRLSYSATFQYANGQSETISKEISR